MTGLPVYCGEMLGPGLMHENGRFGDKSSSLAAPRFRGSNNTLVHERWKTRLWLMRPCDFALSTTLSMYRANRYGERALHSALCHMPVRKIRHSIAPFGTSYT